MVQALSLKGFRRVVGAEQAGLLWAALTVLLTDVAERLLDATGREALHAKGVTNSYLIHSRAMLMLAVNQIRPINANTTKALSLFGKARVRRWAWIMRSRRKETRSNRNALYAMCSGQAASGTESSIDRGTNTSKSRWFTGRVISRLV
jgi:hypothetical protein